jgi:hypothetical protein
MSTIKYDERYHVKKTLISFNDKHKKSRTDRLLKYFKGLVKHAEYYKECMHNW